MAAFDSTTDAGRLDFQWMMWSPVRWIHSRDRLQDAAAWLGQHGYHLLTVDASWMITSHMFRDLGSALGYTCHDQWQCLSEGLASAAQEALSSAEGFALVLTDFDDFSRHHRSDAETLLSVVAHRSWQAALLGQRSLCLVHTQDPSLVVSPISMW